MSEFCASKRIAAGALIMGLGLAGCTEADGVNKYIKDAPSPHSQNDSIPEGKVFPRDAEVAFEDGAAEYHAPREIAASTGLLAVTAFCGNPLDKRDPKNLYAVMNVIEEGDHVWLTAGIAAAEACEDGAITAADKSAL